MCQTMSWLEEDLLRLPGNQLERPNLALSEESVYHKMSNLKHQTKFFLKSQPSLTRPSPCAGSGWFCSQRPEESPETGPHLVSGCYGNVVRTQEEKTLVRDCSMCMCERNTSQRQTRVHTPYYVIS